MPKMRATPDGDLTLIGAELRRLRTLKGYTLVQVREFTGISTFFLSDIERGAAWPSLETLIWLARHYGVPPRRILAILPD